MNVRKIPLSLEVAFWNIVITFLTVFKDIRTFSQTSTASLPTLKKVRTDRPIFSQLKLIITKIKIHQSDICRLAIRASFWAMLGLFTGFLLGLLSGF